MLAPHGPECERLQHRSPTALATQIAALDGDAPPQGPRTARTLKRAIDARGAGASCAGWPSPSSSPFRIHGLHAPLLVGRGLGIDPDRDVRLTVVRAAHRRPRRMRARSTVSASARPGAGPSRPPARVRCWLHGAEPWPRAPDKVLGVVQGPGPRPIRDTLQALGCAPWSARRSWADDPANEVELGVMPSAPAYVDAPAALARALPREPLRPALSYGRRGLSAPGPRPVAAQPDAALGPGGGRPRPGQQAVAAAVYRPDLYLRGRPGRRRSMPGGPRRGTSAPLFDGQVFDPHSP